MSIAYFGYNSIREDLAETLCTSLERPHFPAADPLTEEDVSGREFEIFRPHALPQRELMKAFGFSVGLHATVLILVLLTSFFFRPSHTTLPPFISVKLVDSAGFGTDQEGAGARLEASGGQSENPSPGISFQSDSSPVSEGAVEYPSWKAGSEQNAVENNEEVSTKSNPAQPVEPEQHTTASQRAIVPKSKTKPVRASTPTPKPTGKTSPDEPESTTPPPPQLTETSLHSLGSGPSPGSGYMNGQNSDGIAGAALADKGLGTSSGAQGGRKALSGEYDAKQVDSPPTPLKRVEPEFPLAARRMGITGRVVLRFLVKSDGKVGKASVIEANPGGVFEESALEAIRKWRFHPGHFRGNAVATWVELPIQFRLYR